MAGQLAEHDPAVLGGWWASFPVEGGGQFTWAGPSGTKEFDWDAYVRLATVISQQLKAWREAVTCDCSRDPKMPDQIAMPAAEVLDILGPGDDYQMPDRPFQIGHIRHMPNQWRDIPIIVVDVKV